MCVTAPQNVACYLCFYGRQRPLLRELFQSTWTLSRAVLFYSFLLSNAPPSVLLYMSPSSQVRLRYTPMPDSVNTEDLFSYSLVGFGRHGEKVVLWEDEKRKGTGKIAAAAAAAGGSNSKDAQKVKVVVVAGSSSSSSGASRKLSDRSSAGAADLREGLRLELTLGGMVGIATATGGAGVASRKRSRVLGGGVASRRRMRRRSCTIRKRRRR